jgi:transcriptional regulator with XRE-family HTH domain
MSATLKDKWKALDSKRRAHKLTQARVGKSLGIGQDSVTRLEQRSDVLISILRHYIESMGGSLQLIAEFPNQKPVILSGLTDADELTRQRARRR